MQSSDWSRLYDIQKTILKMKLDFDIKIELLISKIEFPLTRNEFIYIENSIVWYKNME